MWRDQHQHTWSHRSLILKYTLKTVRCHNSLEQVLSTLFLWGEAGHSPDLDLDAGIELLPSHVPHALVGRGHGFVLRRESLLS